MCVYICVCIYICICTHIYIYILHFVYPFIHSLGTLGLIPPFCYCEQCCCEHACTANLFVSLLSFPLITCSEVELLIIYSEVVILFHFLRNRHTVFHSGRTILYSHQQCASIPSFLRLSRHLVSSVYGGFCFVLLIVATLMGVW